MGPGSAAHHHSASQTRVNALLVLRSVRGTYHLTFTAMTSSIEPSEPGDSFASKFLHVFVYRSFFAPNSERTHTQPKIVSLFVSRRRRIAAAADLNRRKP
jgi:hypothetical protein